ncbi:protein-disulfide reductase DsbD family protein [Corallococcus soli]|nr:protein-disulfide reductase DsbD family protein [Corallococcus soli]
MPSPRRFPHLATLLLTLVSAPVLAQDVDPATLYEVTTEGTSTQVKAGGQGTFVLAIKSKAGAHVSDEAPLKLELKGTQLTPAQKTLTLEQSVAKKAQGQQYVDPRFEVPFTAATAGKGTLDATLTFFICTEKICARQKKTFSLPVEVQ